MEKIEREFRRRFTRVSPCRDCKRALRSISYLIRHKKSAIIRLRLRV